MVLPVTDITDKKVGNEGKLCLSNFSIEGNSVIADTQIFALLRQKDQSAGWDNIKTSEAQKMVEELYEKEGYLAETKVIKTNNGLKIKIKEKKFGSITITQQNKDGEFCSRMKHGFYWGEPFSQRTFNPIFNIYANEIVKIEFEVDAQKKDFIHLKVVLRRRKKRIKPESEKGGVLRCLSYVAWSSLKRTLLFEGLHYLELDKAILNLNEELGNIPIPSGNNPLPGDVKEKIDQMLDGIKRKQKTTAHQKPSWNNSGENENWEKHEDEAYVKPQSHHR